MDTYSCCPGNLVLVAQDAESIGGNGQRCFSDSNVECKLSFFFLMELSELCASDVS